MGRLKIFHCRQKATWAFICTVITTVTETVYVTWDRVCLFISGHTILAMCIELLGDELTTPKVRAKAKFSTLYKVWSLTINEKSQGIFIRIPDPFNPAKFCGPYEIPITFDILLKLPNTTWQFWPIPTFCKQIQALYQRS